LSGADGPSRPALAPAAPAINDRPVRQPSRLQALVGEQVGCQSLEGLGQQGRLRRRQGSLCRNATRCCAGAGPQGGNWGCGPDPEKRWPQVNSASKSVAALVAVKAVAINSLREPGSGGWRRPADRFVPASAQCRRLPPQPVSRMGHSSNQGMEQEPGLSNWPPASSASERSGGNLGGASAPAGGTSQQRGR